MPPCLLRHHPDNIGARLVCDCDWRIDLGNTAGCGLSYRCNGNLRAVNDGSRTTGHATFAAGALVRMILDFDAQHVELLVNGASQGMIDGTIHHCTLHTYIYTYTILL